MSQQTQAVAEVQQYLSFFVGEEEYALGILRVREIIEYGAVTRVPGVAGHFRGVINLRGAVVPVVDLALRFAHAPAPTTRRTCIVVVEVARAGASVGGAQGEGVVVGLVADAVNQVIELGDRDVEPVPAFGTGVRPDFLTGMGRHGKGFVLLLDLERVLSSVEVSVAAAAAAAADGEGPDAPGAGSQPAAEVAAAAAAAAEAQPAQAEAGA